MKKTFLAALAIISVVYSTNVLALDLDKLVGAVEGGSGKSIEKELVGKLDPIVEKIEKRVDKLTGRIEERVEKYEKKFDGYEQKMEKAEEAIDRVVDTINNIDKSQIEKYVRLAKLAAIGLASVFILSLLLLVIIFVQTMRINGKLRKLKAV